MEIQELDKKQLVLVTLLITFVVSIATGIVTVSLMQQVPKSVPQTINNVIQRTIEKVTTVQAPIVDNTTETSSNNNNKDTTLLLSSGDEALVSIYSINEAKTTTVPPVMNSSSSPATLNTSQTATALGTTGGAAVGTTEPLKTGDSTKPDVPKALGQGVIISDIGLVLVDSSILTDKDVYKVILNSTDFDATVLKKFTNGFSILKISVKKTPSNTKIKATDGAKNPVDNKI